MTAPRPRPVTPVLRTALRTASAGLTGLAAFGSITATGWVVAGASEDYEQQQAEKAARVEEAAERAAAERAAWLAANPVVEVVTKRRPHRTVVERVFVSGSVRPGSARPGPGGTITRTTASGTSGSTTTSATPAAPPPPPPPPAPSSGS